MQNHNDQNDDLYLLDADDCDCVEFDEIDLHEDVYNNCCRIVQF